MVSQITCTRRLQFAAGHRVMGHESKCRHLHGHNYVVHLTAQAKTGLDKQGRIIDFGVLKAKFGNWIDEYWDHGFILFEDDNAGIETMKRMTLLEKDRKFIQKTYLMPYNPTAENMARYLLESVGPTVLEGTDVVLVGVVVEETENCVADAWLPPDEDSVTKE